MENRKSLESLSLFCHIGGLITMFLGILVGMMDILNSDYRHLQVGIFIFATGYAFLKISSTIAAILSTENKRDY